MSDFPIVSEIRSLLGHTQNVLGLCWLGSSEVLVTGSQDSTARVWGPGQTEAQAVLHHGSVVFCLDWSSTSLLVTGCLSGGECVVWTSAGERVATLSGHSHFILATKFSDSGRLLVTGSEDRTCRVWREEGGSWSCCQVTQCDGGVNTVVWRGEQEFFTGGDSVTIQHWRVGRDTPVQTLRGHTGWVNSLAWDGTGLLASGSSDKTVRFWRPDCPSPAVEPPLRGHLGDVHEVVWGPGTPAILASWDVSPGLRIWSAEGDCLHVLPCAKDGMYSSVSCNISFSPSGLLACRGQEVQVWRPRSGQLEARLQVEGSGVCWGLGGHRLAVVTQEEEDWKRIRVFDTQELGTLRSLRTITLRAVASYLRGRVGKDQEDRKERLSNLGVPRILHKDLQLYMSN